MQKLFGALKRQNYHGKISEKSEKHQEIVHKIYEKIFERLEELNIVR